MTKKAATKSTERKPAAKADDQEKGLPTDSQIWEHCLAQTLTESVNAGYLTNALATGMLTMVKANALQNIEQARGGD